MTGYRLPPGPHGLHVHAAGRCDPPDFTTAGDLPNLVVAPSGEGGIDITTKAVTLGSGPTSLFGPGGTSLVIHAAADDEKTDPTGNSGARLACGVVVR